MRNYVVHHRSRYHKPVFQAHLAQWLFLELQRAKALPSARFIKRQPLRHSQILRLEAARLDEKRQKLFQELWSGQTRVPRCQVRESTAKPGRREAVELRTFLLPRRTLAVVPTV